MRAIDILMLNKRDKAAFSENFNSYSDGNLDGQGGWVASTNLKVQGSTVKEGSKAISCNVVAKKSDALKIIPPHGSGIYSIWFMKTANLTGGFAILDIYDNLIGLVYVSGSAVYFFGASQVTLSGSLSNNTWSKFEIELDAGNKRVRGRHSGGTWSGWQTMNYLVVEKVAFDRNTGGSGTAYYDLIKYYKT